MKKIKISKPIIITGVLLVILGLVLVITLVRGSSTPQSSTKDAQNNETVSNELSDGVSSSDQAKDKIVREQEAAKNTPKPTGKRTVTPLITFAEQVNGNIEVAAYVPGISEEGGSCTLTATRSGQTITKTVIASQNANTTDCQAFVIARSEFQAGTWSLKVSYESNNANGSSESWQLTIK